jgi:hypothetical protein
VPWENCFLASLSPSDGTTFDHIGPTLLAILRRDGSNLPESEQFAEAVALHFGDLARPLRDSRPVRGEGSIASKEGTVLYRSVLLPFVDAAQRPSYVLGAMTYRIDPARR